MQIIKWKKKPIWKGYIPYDSSCMTLWTKQNNGGSTDSGCQGLGQGRDELAEHGGFLGQWTILYDTIIVDTYYYIFV